VVFEVIESIHQMPMGQAGYSATYDLDMSKALEFGSQAECVVAQVLKAGEADRFAIAVSAPKHGILGGWRCATKFKTNFGTVVGPDLEFWVPIPKKAVTFGSLLPHYISQLEKNATAYAAEHPGIKPSQLVKTEPGEKAGFRTYFPAGGFVVIYYGAKPLINDAEKESVPRS
jgi:hypothetical protein